MPPCAPTSWPLTILAAGLIILSAIAAYRNSFAGPFVYDDLGAIVANPTIRQLWPIWPALSPPRSIVTVGGRPLVNLSLAINYALGGLNVWGYHATNLMIHIAAALLLMGILRRTFLMPALRERLGTAAMPLALAAALLWMLHPLQTESVTYIAQRAESLMGLFYLLTLYCVIRGTGAGTVPFFARGLSPFSPPSKPCSPSGLVGEKGDCPLSPAQTTAGETPALQSPGDKGDGPPRRYSRLWYAAAVLACLLGTASKEVMVTAPLMVLLYDRTFLAGSFAEALRQRWKLYVGLAATWGLLGYLVVSAGPSDRPSGLPAPDAWSYARTQPGVILHYLRLSAWPSPLCFHNEWPVANTLGEILPGVVLVGLLLAATVWGLLRRKGWGLLGAWFLLILAPTSSILPLRQLAVEHRMYLPLAAITVLAVTGGYWLGDKSVRRPAASGLAVVWRRAAPVVLLVAVLLALGCATASRNADYRSAMAIWQDTVNKRPHSAIAHYNLATVLDGLGRTEEAIQQYQQALQVKPDYAEAMNNLGRDLAGFGRIDEAVERFRQALRWKPDYPEAHNNLGNALAKMGNTAEAVAAYDRALRLEPNYAEAYHNLGTVLANSGNTAVAIQQYRQALRLKPNYAEAHHSLGHSLATSGRTEEAIEQYHEALRLKPDYTEAHHSLGSALFTAGKISEAIEQYAEAVRLKPYSASVHHNLGVALATVGKTAEAIEQYQQALQLKPDYAEAHSNLGAILAGSGNSGEAIEHYQEALRLKPNYAEAHSNLGAALVAAGRTAEAIEHDREALRLKPNYAEAHNNLANALTGLGSTDEAIEHYAQALRIKPHYLMAHVNLAWLLATRESAQGGDPDRAVQLAQRALELGGNRNARCLDTLAAAYAAAGRFPEAVATAEKARQLAESSGQSTLAASIQARLELYRAGRPHREAPPSAQSPNR